MSDNGDTGGGGLGRAEARAVVTLDRYRRLNGAMLQNAQTIHPISALHELLATRDAHLLARLLGWYAGSKQEGK
jgi:hypothetical protein